MYLLDDYLKSNGVSRYKVSKISGVSQTTLAEYKEKELKTFPVYLLDAVGMVTGKKSWEVLEELKWMENRDDLNGFEQFLKKHEASFPALEIKLAALLDTLNDKGVTIDPFSFNRFENEPHDDIEADVEIALKNAITSLETALKNLEDGNPPLSK